MKTYKYMNAFTGELYENLFHAIKTIISDMIHYKTCRTIKMFHLRKGKF